MKTSETKTWQRTKTPGLLRHKGGRYYGRFTLGGKTFFKPLETDLLEIARTRFAEERARVERRRKAARATDKGSGRMGDLLTLYKARLEERQDIGSSTRARYVQHADYISNTWPGFEKLTPDEISLEALEAWRNRALKEGSGYRPPGAKESEAPSGNSAGSFNKAVDALRRMLDLAVERGALHVNPIARRGVKAKDTPRKPALPDSAALLRLFSEIEAKPRLGGWSLEIADFCRFIAFTGCRLSEANAVYWRDVDTAKGEITIRGTKTEAALRTVPLLPDARKLLEKIRARREKAGRAGADTKVLAVAEAQKSLSEACTKLGLPRLTHHDLRDAFCTACIHAGVPIPTIAKWAGHKDGGALLLRRYAHVPDTVSHKQAEGVKFG